MNIKLDELFKLSAAERIQLAEDLWDSVAADPGSLPPLSEDELGGIVRRILVHARDTSTALRLVELRSPTLVAATWPCWKIISVGIPRTPYLVGICGFSSMLTLATVSLPSYSLASSSSEGAIMRHGPHHSAQKSTTTGVFASRTSA